MRVFGFSTGSVARSDFRGALAIMRETRLTAVELSALREGELQALIESVPNLPLDQFSYVSIHAPSRFDKLSEREIVRMLTPVFDRGHNVIVHPDTISDSTYWMPFGRQVCVENMDNRKRIGRTAKELSEIFRRLPDASLCFDIGHAWNIDRTMSEADDILSSHKVRLRQVHLSEVDLRCAHKPLTIYTISAFQKVATLIPKDVPIIIESVLPGAPNAQKLAAELEAARYSLETGSSATTWFSS